MSTMNDSQQQSPPIRLRRTATSGKPEPAWPAYPGLAPTMAPAPAAKPSPAAGPKTKPKPKPKPPTPKPTPQPIAAAARPALPRHGSELPAVPLSAADVPVGAKAVAGTLLRDANAKNGRPIVMIRTPCTCSSRVHYYPWRSDWPVDGDVRSHQESRCKKHKGPGGVWIGIDPEGIGRSLEAVREMREALSEWKADRTNQRTSNPKETTHVDVG